MAFNTDLQQSITDELEVIVSHRAIIDQAKGMLMLLYQVSADAAFAVLKWRSQQLNVKLSTVAAKLLADVPEVLNALPATRPPIDHYLMTLTPPPDAAAHSPVHPFSPTHRQSWPIRQGPTTTSLLP